MTIVRLRLLITVILYAQGLHGQQSGTNNSPIGQNSLNQVFTSTKTPSENFIQNGSTGNVGTNPNTHISVNFQPSIPQSQMSTQSPLSIQQTQNVPTSSNLQLTQIPNFQQALMQPPIHFTDNPYLQQTLLPQSSIMQQPQNMPQSTNVYKVPLNMQQVPYVKLLNSQQPLNLGDFNLLQQIPVQPSQSVAIPNAAFMTSYPPLSSCPCQRTDFMNNIGNSYIGSSASVPFSVIENPHFATYSPMPVMTVLSTPNTLPLIGNGNIMPYGNQAPNIIDSPLRVSNGFYEDEDMNPLDEDKFTSLLLSLIQIPKKPKYEQLFGYPGNPYGINYQNQGSKTSTIKALLPIILNLINERKEGCGCRESCQNCERKRKIKKETDPEIFGGYSKKRDSNLKNETFRNCGSEEQNIKSYRDKKSKKNKIPIPIISDESFECEVAQYEDLSEEDID